MFVVVGCGCFWLRLVNGGCFVGGVMRGVIDFTVWFWGGV